MPTKAAGPRGKKQAAAAATAEAAPAGEVKGKGKDTATDDAVRWEQVAAYFQL